MNRLSKQQKDYLTDLVDKKGYFRVLNMSKEEVEILQAMNFYWRLWQHADDFLCNKFYELKQISFDDILNNI